MEYTFTELLPIFSLIILIPIYSFILHQITIYMKYGETDFIKASQIVIISQVINLVLSYIPDYIILNTTSTIIFAIGSFVISLAITIILINLIYGYSWKNTLIIFLIYWVITFIIGLILGLIIIFYVMFNMAF